MTDRASPEGLREAIDAALHELGEPGPGYPAPVANAVDILRAAIRDTGPRPDSGIDHALHYDPSCEECAYLARPVMLPRPDSGIDPRVVEAFDVLGAMWSWSEDNGYFATGSGAVLAAGRLLKEVVGRPAQPLSTPRTETSE